MVLEVALIDVVPGHEDAFAAAYAEGRRLVATAPGCRSVRMTRGIESPTRFVLLVEWDSVEAHEQNFRATERFTAWRALIGPHFVSPPHVEHFRDLGSGSGEPGRDLGSGSGEPGRDLGSGSGEPGRDLGSGADVSA